MEGLLGAEFKTKGHLPVRQGAEDEVVVRTFPTQSPLPACIPCSRCGAWQGGSSCGLGRGEGGHLKQVPSSRSKPTVRGAQLTLSHSSRDFVTILKTATISLHHVSGLWTDGRALYVSSQEGSCPRGPRQPQVGIGGSWEELLWRVRWTWDSFEFWIWSPGAIDAMCAF